MSGPREQGLLSGCCAGLLALVLLVGGSAFLAERALSAPVLGAPPAGPSHGDTETAIALALGGDMSAQLIAGTHGVVTLSEEDLTVLGRANNPHPDQYRDLTVRVRSGQLIVSAEVSVGPLSPTVVAHVELTLAPGAQGPQLVSQVAELDVGMLGLPGIVRDRLSAPLEQALSLDALFAHAPALQPLRVDIECIAIAGDGVAIGVHRPGAAADPSSCG